VQRAFDDDNVAQFVKKPAVDARQLVNAIHTPAWQRESEKQQQKVNVNDRTRKQRLILKKKRRKLIGAFAESGSP
jgi:hypothetical protein